jgi:hypothetical protein
VGQRTRGFIKLFRKTKWRLTPKGQSAIKYHDERNAWMKERKKVQDNLDV